MNRWTKLLLISLPLAIVLTAAFRFIQHTDDEYSFWVEIYAETTALVEARCVAIRSAAASGFIGGFRPPCRLKYRGRASASASVQSRGNAQLWCADAATAGVAQGCNQGHSCNRPCEGCRE